MSVLALRHLLVATKALRMVIFIVMVSQQNYSVKIIKRFWAQFNT